jgi:hypothetical protein
VAETTSGDLAALGVLRRCGAVLSYGGTEVRGETPLGPH